MSQKRRIKVDKMKLRRAKKLTRLTSSRFKIAIQKYWNEMNKIQEELEKKKKAKEARLAKKVKAKEETNETKNGI